MSSYGLKGSGQVHAVRLAGCMSNGVKLVSGKAKVQVTVTLAKVPEYSDI